MDWIGAEHGLKRLPKAGGGPWRRVGVVVLALTVLPVFLFQASATGPEQAPSSSVASEELEQTGRDLAERLTAPDSEVRQQLKAWAGRLMSSDASVARNATEVLRAAVAEIVATRPLTSRVQGASEASRLRFLFEVIAESMSSAVSGTGSGVWNALERVTTPLGTGGIVRRTRHAEVLAQTLWPPFDWLEGRLVAWNLIHQGTSALETGVTAVDRIQPNGLSRIEATVISAPTGRVRVDEVAALIDDLTHWDPERRVLVLADGSNFEQLLACCSSDLVAVRPSFGRPFSPWPRDAMTFARSSDGSPLLLMRPNEVPGRELDALMGRALLQFNDLERVATQPVHWLTSPVPFHNGQILFTPGETWVSIHSLERRALELLGLDSVPTTSFATQRGLETYLDAVRRAAGEYEVLFSQPVGFVHPLPASGPAERREAEMWALAGGAGWDLDSLITILPRVADLPVTLVGSAGLGQALVASIGDDELRAWLDSLRLTSVSTAAARVALSGPLARRTSLQQFLDVTAEHLEGIGHEVVRVPLLVLPQNLARQLKADVLIGMHNVVLERGRRGPRAEGFSSGLQSLDQHAIDLFRVAGYELRLVPAISDSILLNAGYRCSTNHLRSSQQLGPGELRHISSQRGVDLSISTLVDDR